jgi:hypothetical protein
MPNGPKVQVRNYDKGERRFKHVGRGSKPYIQFDEMQPRKWIGKCPDNIPDSKKKELLNKAVVAPSGDRDIDYVKQLYVVHEGAIYEAQTSDGGRSYHAYPYRGKLSKSLMEALEAMAVNEGTLVAFRDWVGKYIEIGGKQ